ncbi:tRNA (adenosine(37)-N6)-dimethylallyltransferase MiaA [Acetobacter sp. LMG 32666]|uniref:tRNA (adenosine(37)-N6)-dimethylallyltransferase MiaA n=1 Tax=Acetobacter sp. LMG 32666 TaxID=2959295 RepID=UPI0030C88B30
MKQAEHPCPAPATRQTERQPPALILAGPTCSGKSALALKLARQLGGVVINADSMQVYKDLRVLTARPSVLEEQLVPHRLYGVLPAAHKGSVAWWREQALAAMQQAWAAGQLPILCGGTGLYIRALTDGLALIPQSAPAVQQAARALVAEEGAPAVHARLMAVDPQTAMRLKPVDSQRVARAWEVWQATGHGLDWWQAQPGLPPAPAHFVAVRLYPPRPELRARIQVRFAAMLEQGGVEEVRDLLQQNLDPDLPVMRAHGVPELAAMLRGEITQAEAASRAIAATGRYTKRQATWFAHHPLTPEGRTCMVNACFANSEQFSERKYDEIVSFILKGIDAPDIGS